MTPPEPLTAFEKLRRLHSLRDHADGGTLLRIDRIMLHERTGAVALWNMIEEGRAVRDPSMVFATIDHIVSTRLGERTRARAPGGEVFMERMRDACDRLGLRLFAPEDPRQGIVHVIAPEQGIVMPGITMVCPDSHTCTLGGLGALAWGIGSTDCEHALTTRALRVGPVRAMRVTLGGERPGWLTPKDVAIHLIARHGAAGGRGHAVEFDGPAIRAMPVEERLTLCNMGVEFGAFAAFVTPDDAVFDYLRGRPFAPPPAMWDAAVAHWKTLASDTGARFDAEIALDVSDLAPAVSWGTSPEHAVPVTAAVPEPTDETRRKALRYMDLAPGRPLAGLPVDGAFIGSCTNARLSDLRRAAEILRGRRVAPGISAVCVPGSTAVKRAAEAEGLDAVFRAAGFAWQESGCAMCFYAGGETFPPGARVVSSTNRNFEGRQGPGVRTHIASPETVAWSAVRGCLADMREAPAIVGAAG
jgi:3-isopropylmalate/(R)-2-methylmalate dehydratase large subunit